MAAFVQMRDDQIVRLHGLVHVDCARVVLVYMHSVCVTRQKTSEFLLPEAMSTEVYSKEEKKGASICLYIFFLNT